MSRATGPAILVNRCLPGRFLSAIAPGRLQKLIPQETHILIIDEAVTRVSYHCGPLFYGNRWVQGVSEKMAIILSRLCSKPIRAKLLIEPKSAYSVTVISVLLSENFLKVTTVLICGGKSAGIPTLVGSVLWPDSSERLCMNSIVTKGTIETYSQME